MPAKLKFSKEEIIAKAYHIVEEQGFDKLTARNLASELGSSCKVIFGSFYGMDDIKEQTIKHGYKIFGAKMLRALNDKTQPSYITCGACYINFARTKTNVFKMLFMRNTIKEINIIQDQTIDTICEFISKKSGLSLEDAREAHDKYWFVMHGIATSIVTEFVSVSDDIAKLYLKEMYEGIVKEIKERKKYGIAETKQDK